MGAWIEIKYGYPATVGVVSHPTWVRGLKLSNGQGWDTSALSHPTWVRGLKYRCSHAQPNRCTRVAPHVGAWIEIIKSLKDHRMQVSHPTWVRGLKCLRSCRAYPADMSHPTWVRGLKFEDGGRYVRSRGSHPTWVRGLKFNKSQLAKQYFGVAPHVGAWIEINSHNFFFSDLGSHPTWVRGLKYT